MQWVWLAVVAVVLMAVLAYYRKQKRRSVIRNHVFHRGLMIKFQRRHPQLTPEQVHRVRTALLDYFEICQRANKRFVSMPSQVVDDLWHEFILFTKQYEAFCNKAFGRFLHHTPVEAMEDQTTAQEGIRRTWRLACSLESIDPKSPERLPRLFAIDKELGIENGFYYTLDCRSARTGDYCAAHIGCGSCGSGCGGGTNCGSSCGGGCGGD